MHMIGNRLSLIFLIFVIGMLADLLLIEHFESGWQIVPVVFLILSTVSFLFLKAVAVVRAFFRVWMYLGMASGVLGLFFHVKSNWEFATELYADLKGWKLLTEVATGAIPVISPGFLIPIALFGLYLLRIRIDELEKS